MKNVMNAIKTAIMNGFCDIELESFEISGFKVSLSGKGLKEKLKLAGEGKFQYRIDSLAITGLLIDMGGNVDENFIETTIEE